MSKRYTKEEFIKKSVEIHGDRYDYSKVEYINSRNKVIIICKIHGDFEQVPYSHMSDGNGCIKCNMSKLNTELFIKKSVEIHGDRYDYSLTKYINGKNVDIICKIHGLFNQNHSSHLRGKGCSECVGLLRLNNDIFIKRSEQIHGDKYDYSLVDIKNSKNKILIICKIHGNFIQSPHKHLIGRGCVKCGTSYGKKENKWLDNFDIRKEYRQYRIDKYIVDGYDPITNTVYEFNGDYWHGNPIKYEKDEINKSCNKTFGELYNSTLEKENKLKVLGYNFISIWESDFI